MTPASTPTPHTVNFLILGAGWTSTFLLPLLTTHNITHAATTRAGSSTTIPFTFDPGSDDPAPYRVLPSATTVLITFPITVAGATTRLVDLYTSTHTSSASVRFIQLGSTSVWNGPGTSTRHTPIDPSHARGAAEAELLALGGCVLNLAGLWGSTRNPKNWVSRVADTREKLRGKGSLHLVHGEDLARAIIAVYERWTGGRWIVTDLRSYDWWDLALAWGGEDHQTWVLDLMGEMREGVLPRGVQERDRVLDSTEFWRTFGVRPGRCLFI